MKAVLWTVVALVVLALIGVAGYLVVLLVSGPDNQARPAMQEQASSPTPLTVEIMTPTPEPTQTPVPTADPGFDLESLPVVNPDESVRVGDLVLTLESTGKNTQVGTRQAPENHVYVYARITISNPSPNDWRVYPGGFQAYAPDGQHLPVDVIFPEPIELQPNDSARELPAVPVPVGSGPVTLVYQDQVRFILP
jgi:hypothetical protein